MLRTLADLQMPRQLLDGSQNAVVDVIYAFQIGVIVPVVKGQRGNSFFDGDRSPTVFDPVNVFASTQTAPSSHMQKGLA